MATIPQLEIFCWDLHPAGRLLYRNRARGGNRLLKMMWMAGYISKDRQGKQVYYALANSRVREAIEFFEEMYPADAYGPNANREGCPE